MTSARTEDQTKYVASNGQAADNAIIQQALEIAANRLQGVGGDAMSSSSAVASYLQLYFAADDTTSGREKFVVMFLNTKNRLIETEIMGAGTVDQVAVYPREVIKSALLCNATGMVLAHNHPSGVTQPSTQDKKLTRELVSAANCFKMRIHDHIIVAGADCFSFLANGMM